MIKVSKKSWHYWVAKVPNGGDIPSNSLCIYFWQIIIGLIMLAFGVAAACFAAFLLLTPVLMFFFPHEEILNMGLLMCYIYLIVIAVLLSRKVKSKVAYQDNLFFKYVAAKKKRICPILDFVEDKKQ